MRITVIGCGYLGATHAACMAELGFEVLGVEIDPAKREGCEPAGCRSTSPASRSCSTKHVDDRPAALHRLVRRRPREFGDVHFICVGTPQLADSLGADLSQVDGGGRAARRRT